MVPEGSHVAFGGAKLAMLSLAQWVALNWGLATGDYLLGACHMEGCNVLIHQLARIGSVAAATAAVPIAEMSK